MFTEVTGLVPSSFYRNDTVFVENVKLISFKSHFSRLRSTCSINSSNPNDKFTSPPLLLLSLSHGCCPVFYLSPL